MIEKNYLLKPGTRVKLTDLDKLPLVQQSALKNFQDVVFVVKTSLSDTYHLYVEGFESVSCLLIEEKDLRKGFTLCKSVSCFYGTGFTYQNIYYEYWSNGRRTYARVYVHDLFGRIVSFKSHSTCHKEEKDFDINVGVSLALARALRKASLQISNCNVDLAYDISKDLDKAEENGSFIVEKYAKKVSTISPSSEIDRETIDKHFYFYRPYSSFVNGELEKHNLYNSVLKTKNYNNYEEEYNDFDDYEDCDDSYDYDDEDTSSNYDSSDHDGDRLNHNYKSGDRFYNNTSVQDIINSVSKKIKKSELTLKELIDTIFEEDNKTIGGWMKKKIDEKIADTKSNTKTEDVKSTDTEDVKSPDTKPDSSTKTKKEKLGKAIDLTDEEFGHLIAVSPVGSTKDGHKIWDCTCDCGNLCQYTSSQLLQGKVDRCPECKKKDTTSKTVSKKDTSKFDPEIEKAYQDAISVDYTNTFKDYNMTWNSLKIGVEGWYKGVEYKISGFRREVTIKNDVTNKNYKVYLDAVNPDVVPAKLRYISVDYKDLFLKEVE